MAIVWALLFVLAMLIAWCTNLLGLPGNWLMVALAVVYWILKPADAGATLSITVLIVMAVLAAVGELLEISMSAVSISKAGGGRKSAWYAISGSIVGGIVGIFMGVPLPLIGPIAGSLLFGSLGAMAGAVFSEIASGQTWAQCLRIGKAAFLGRALGTLAKMAVGLAMICVAVVGLII
jgi:uncharacterized protein YqgC (DUF456 family)